MNKKLKTRILKHIDVYLTTKMGFTSPVALNDSLYYSRKSLPTAIKNDSDAIIYIFNDIYNLIYNDLSSDRKNGNEIGPAKFSIDDLKNHTVVRNELFKSECVSNLIDAIYLGLKHSPISGIIG